MVKLTLRLPGAPRLSNLSGLMEKNPKIWIVYQFDTFFVVVTDDNGNRLKVDNITLKGPDELMVTNEVVNSGLNESTGFIDLSISGGTAPYSFEWSNGQVTEDNENLEKGT